MTDSHYDYQRQVTEHFESEAGFWDVVYRTTDVYAKIHQYRRAIILRMIAQLPLPRNARVLEVGCGAGHTTVELARQGYSVQAVDTAKAMLNFTLQHAAEANVSDRVSVSLGDAHNLHFAENAFELVTAAGVLQFLHSPAAAIRDMTRVARPGGYLLITSGNYWSLDRILDPYWNPCLRNLGDFGKKIVNSLGLHDQNICRAVPQVPRSFPYSSNYLRDLTNSAGLEQHKLVTVGFGPFTFYRKNVLPDSIGIWLNERLQWLGDRNFPVLSGTGRSQILLARKMPDASDRC